MCKTAFLRAALWVGAVTAVLGSSSHALALLIIASDTEVTVSEIGDEFAVNYECTTADTCGDAESPGLDLTAISFWEVTDISNRCGHSSQSGKPFA